MPATSITAQTSAPKLMARMRNPNTGNYPTLAETSTVSVTVTDAISDTIIRTFTPSKSSVISDTMVIDDADWQQDSTGYCIFINLDASDTAKLTTIEATLTITPTTGTPYPITWVIQVVPEDDA
jgi:hypothetical protein